MPDSLPASSSSRAVFLSYASQDVEVARRICDSLRGAGVEVWFDADGGLQHGDEWDTKIRRQIRDCLLFIPIISAHTQARLEGYFRLEWELAAQRALTIASGVPFILPIVIDDTREPEAAVPDRFRTVQWTRLRGGEVTPEVQRRLIQLWSERIGGTSSAAARPAVPSGAAMAAPHPSGRPRSAPSLAFGFGVAGVVVAAGLAWWLLRDRGPSGPVTPAPSPGVPAAAAATAVPGSEARQLARKAQVRFQELEATRDDFALAEEYCQQAYKLDPYDGEVCAIYSQLDAAFNYRGWDTSPERREHCRSMAERAIRLAPNSPEAKLAQAGAWSTFGVNRAETEKLLREVVKDQPTDQAALRFLAVVALRRGDLNACLALNERSAALSGGDPLALYNNARYLWDKGREADAYATLQRSLAQQPFSSSLVLDAIIEMNWRADLGKAEAALEKIPPSAQLEDRANYTAGLVHYCQRNAAGALAVWNTFPRDYYNDFQYDGPKGLLIGLADELDHRDAAARIEWKVALQLVEKRIAATPNSGILYYYRGYLLVCLGEKAAAEEAERTSEQLMGADPTARTPVPMEVALVYARLGRLDEIFAHPPSHGLGRLLLDPRFETLRADPRYPQLLAKHRQELAASKP